MTDAVAGALQRVGCPPPKARELAGRARIEPHDGELLLVLSGHGTAVDVPVEPAAWEYAAQVVAGNVAAENAEAVDRSARGQASVTVLWPLPDRRQRR
ncbi:hypothetical protein [Blastococcus litoris]|uniref:hypothetical protein n=1 Tax=Blastococcus litoris TaxID=2171622 RepID=UPI000E30A16B|nr:hypothetical protein [Blastococcus litoris]